MSVKKKNTRKNRGAKLSNGGRDVEHGQNEVVDGKAPDQRRQAVQRAEKKRQAPTKAGEKRENHPQGPDEDGGQNWVKPR